MSSKLVVEFYEEDAQQPLAVVLAFHGGDNPADAGLTLAAFIVAARLESEPRFLDAGTLASQFIVWSTRSTVDLNKSLQVDAVLIESSKDYVGQVLRIRVQKGMPEVEIVPDEYTREAELAEGFAHLNTAGVTVKCAGEAMKPAFI